MWLEDNKYLYDIDLAAERVQRFAAGKTFADYLGGVMLRSAVERQFEIIGEALAQLSHRNHLSPHKSRSTSRLLPPEHPDSWIRRNRRSQV